MSAPDQTSPVDNVGHTPLVEKLRLLADCRQQMGFDRAGSAMDSAADTIDELLEALEDLLTRDCPNRPYVLGHPAAANALAALAKARGQV